MVRNFLHHLQNRLGKWQAVPIPIKLIQLVCQKESGRALVLNLDSENSSANILMSVEAENDKESKMQYLREKWKGFNIF